MTILCECGHPLTSHQTGEGPWTGFCWETLAGIGETVPCECEAPTPVRHPFDPADPFDPGASLCRGCGLWPDDPVHGGEVESI